MYYKERDTFNMNEDKTNQNINEEETGENRYRRSDPEIRKKIGLGIKRGRKKARLTQEKLAEMTGYSSTYISYIERGIKCPSLEGFIRIADAIQSSKDILLEEVSEYKDFAQVEYYTKKINETEMPRKKRIFEFIGILLDENIKIRDLY